jgi:hypothetical protein
LSFSLLLPYQPSAYMKINNSVSLRLTITAAILSIAFLHTNNLRSHNFNSRLIGLNWEQSDLPLGVPIPKLVLADDVRAYIKSLLAAPIPANYRLPDDILSQTEYEKAVAMVNKHFPEFSELEGDDLLRAVKNNPVRYQSLILEAKSVREHFFPGSQKKATN